MALNLPMREHASMNIQITPAVTWRTHLSLALLALVYIFSVIDRQIIAILMEPIKTEFGATDTQMGLLSGLAFGLFYAALGVPVGKLADKYNRRMIVAVCCSLWSVATVACGFAGQFWQLLLSRMSVAIGEAGGMAPSISLVSDLYPPKQRSTVISLFMTGPNLAVVIGLSLGGWIAQQYGWPVAAAESLWKQIYRLLQLPAFRRVAFACGIAGLAGYAYGVWTPSFLVRTHGLSLAHAGLMFGFASGFGALVGGLFSGWLCDRLVQRDVRWQVGLPMLGVLISLPCALAFLLWPSEGYWAWAGLKIPHAMAFSIAFGFFGSWWPSLSYSAISHMVRSSERGVAAALLNFFITLFGIGVGPLLTGVISDLLTPSMGAQALRWSLVLVMLLLIPTAILLGMSLQAYRAQWTFMNKDSQ